MALGDKKKKRVKDDRCCGCCFEFKTLVSMIIIWDGINLLYHFMYYSMFFMGTAV
jgi:hypothetical protein